MSAKQTYRLAIQSITVTRAGKSTDYQHGDVLGGVHPSNLQSMIHLKQAISAEAFDELYPPISESPPEPTDWRQTKVADLAVAAQVVAALTAANLATVADVLVYGDTHKGLTSISGIGEASETAIKDAIERLSEND